MGCAHASKETPMATYPMAPVDAAWYHMDGQANHAMITGVLTTRRPLSFEKVKGVFRHRLARFERYRQRVVEKGFPLAAPYWEDVTDFDVGQQLHHIALPAPHDRAALIDLVSDLASMPLDHARPLWEGHLVDDVDGGSALVLRMHHCLGDGTAAMLVCRELFDETPDAPVEDDEPSSEDRVGRPGVATAAAPPVAGDAGDGDARGGPLAIEALARRAVALAAATWDTVRNPEPLLAKARLAVDGAAMLGAELLKRPDPPSPLKGPFRPEKRVAWSSPVPLADVKAIGAPIGAKINDVLVAAMSGALRNYLHSRGVRLDRASVRAMVPVDLRPPSRAQELGNSFGLVILELPLSSDRSRDRLRLTKKRMDALKRSPEPGAILTLFDLFGRLPKAVGDAAVDLFGSKASLVMTNVAGPKAPLYFAGAAIDRLFFCVPHPGRQLGMGISIMSYDGRATLTVVADAHLVPDPESITDAFGREFARMARNAKRRQAKEAPAERPASRPRSASAAAKGRQARSQQGAAPAPRAAVRRAGRAEAK
jgi:WS/DGAT/MGAT family acyltransferase